MTFWHGYFVVERQNIGTENWSSLQFLFEDMGVFGSPFPAYNNHKRSRLDADAVIYESNFESSEVTMEAFKQLLADEFEVAVTDIDDTANIVTYGDYRTIIWQFIYPIGGLDRFKVERFGEGNSWEVSRNECLGYLKVNQGQWG